MAFPSGDWNLYANGFRLDLFIQESADQTTVNGFVYTDPAAGNQQSFTIQEGTWNDTLSEITFKFEVDVKDGEGNTIGKEAQTYRGFLFDRGVANLPNVPRGEASVMAGIFTSQGGFENPVKAATGWGWFAYSVGEGG